MSLSNVQQQLIVGMILGDSTAERNGKHTRIRTAHTVNQKEYLLWKHQLLDSFSNRPRFQGRRDNRTGKVYEQWIFSTRTLPVFDVFRKKFYSGTGRKIVPQEIDRWLTNPLTLAVWFMDDGYRRSDCKAYRISTDGFTRKENELLCSILRMNFDLEVSVHQKGKWWNLYIPSGQVEKFNRVVEPYIVETMRYKLVQPRNDFGLCFGAGRDGFADLENKVKSYDP